MVMTLSIPLRHIYGLEDFITLRHLDNMAKVMLATGLIVSYGYLMEVFYAYYSGNEYERAVALNRALGPYAWTYWALIVCNFLVPQLFWIRAARRNIPLLFLVALTVNVGMWLERFVIIVVSLHRDYLPSAWRMYYPTVWDFAQFFGSIGLFFTLLFLFLRFLPVISIFELRELVVHGEGSRDNH
jgi:molybdopterin-containing oxidoreductase family membrane subunit